MAGSSDDRANTGNDDVSMEPSLESSPVAEWINVSPELTSSLSGTRLLSGPIVDVFVGPSRRRWTLHVNLLCHHSEPLATELLGPQSPDALSSNGHSPALGSPPETPMTLELPEEDPAGFELLVKWLYQGRLDSVSQLANDEQKYDYAVACHKLYLLCERFELRQLKNQAIDEYRKGLSESSLVPDAAELNEIYRSSPVDSAFRKLMVQIAARQIMDPEARKGADEYRSCFEDPEFGMELVNAIKVGTGGLLFEDPTEGSSCSWHDHLDGASCHTKAKRKQDRPLSYHFPKPAPAPKRRVSPAAAPASTAPTKLDDLDDIDGLDSLPDDFGRRPVRHSNRSDTRRQVFHLHSEQSKHSPSSIESTPEPDATIGAPVPRHLASRPNEYVSSRPLQRARTPPAGGRNRVTSGVRGRGGGSPNGAIINGTSNIGSSAPNTPVKGGVSNTGATPGRTPNTGSARKAPPKLRRRGSAASSQ